MLDYLISILPKPLLIPAVRLFMPKTYALLSEAKSTTRDGKTLLSWRGKEGYVVVDDKGIRMPLVISYDELALVQALNERRDRDYVDFMDHTCCDYVDSLLIDGARFGVTVFVEPAGNVTKWGRSFSEVLNWWVEVFKSQPSDWDYCKAGWHLLELENLPEEPQEVWNENIGD